MMAFLRKHAISASRWLLSIGITGILWTVAGWSINRKAPEPKLEPIVWRDEERHIVYDPVKLEEVIPEIQTDMRRQVASLPATTPPETTAVVQPAPKAPDKPTVPVAAKPQEPAVVLKPKPQSYYTPIRRTWIRRRWR